MEAGNRFENHILRQIPQIDALLQRSGGGDHSHFLMREALRRVLDELRQGLLSGSLKEVPPPEELLRRAGELAAESRNPRLKPLINGTGVILHTNFGRACLSAAAAEAACRAAEGYSNLEYDLERGERGSRYSHTEELLARLTGCESSLVVNNNAGAVLLMLSALAKGKEVVVSRGELVEIGGSFRVPEVMEQGGAILREAGTTNKTRLADYEAAITPQTAALLKVHTSNYRIVGFTEEVSLADLAALGKKRGLPVLEDLGSGALINPERYGIRGEPWAPASLAAGADVVTFSGDKLLGGPQAGIICGKKRYIDLIKKHPLNRALRAGKMSLAALEATLAAYLEPGRAEEEIPLLRMLGIPAEELRARAERLCRLLSEEESGYSDGGSGDSRGNGGGSGNGRGVAEETGGKAETAAAARERGALPGGTAQETAEVVASESQAGGGSVPHQMLPSYAVALRAGDGDAEGLARRLRGLSRPIVGRIYKDRFLLDMRCLREEDFSYIAGSIKKVL